MPLPTPNSGEERDAFVGRCMSALKSEFPDQKQRAAVCYRQWRKKMAKAFEGKLRIVKADDEKHLLYCPVLLADTEDAQGDVIPADEVEKAAHRFFKEYTLGTAELGLDHKSTLDREKAHLVESWLAKVDEDYGDEVIPAGTWMVGWHIPDDELWKSAKSGKRSGLSMEGTGLRSEL